MHADHITGTGRLKSVVPGCQSLISQASGAKADVHVAPSDKVQFGRHQLEVRPTPGHTSGWYSFFFFPYIILFLFFNKFLFY